MGEIETKKTEQYWNQLEKQYTGNWVVRAVGCMVELTERSLDPRWMAQKLDVSIEEILKSLDILESLGIIKKTPEGGFKKILKYVYYTDRNMVPEHVLADHVLISSQLMSRLKPRDDKRGSFYRTSFVATNIELAKKYFLKIEQTLKDFLIESAQSESDTVIACSFSGVELTEKSSPKKGEN
ncbi:MAG: DUF4423 domain-containing protein [Bdellovibrionales bacterium]|nr:DUF4423 domain-containing protein [Bdellovibrionales bacterium]